MYGFKILHLSFTMCAFINCCLAVIILVIAGNDNAMNRTKR